MIPVLFQFAVNVRVTSYFRKDLWKKKLAEMEGEVKITVKR
jgi:hypothetical protein